MFQYEKNWYQSKKVWFAVASALLVMLKSAFPHAVILDALTDDKLAMVVGVAMTYILGQSHVDAKTRAASILADAKPFDTTPGLTNEKSEASK